MNKALITLATTLVVAQSGFCSAIGQQELPVAQLKKQNKTLVQLAATEINKTLPQTVDKYTRLIKVEGKETTMLYTFEINTGSKSDETVQKEDRTRMKKAITHGICKSSKRFLDAQINIAYLYISAKSKAKLFRFDVSQSDCANMK